MMSVTPLASTSAQASRSLAAMRSPAADDPFGTADGSRVPATFTSMRGVPVPVAVALRANTTSSKPSLLTSQTFSPSPKVACVVSSATIVPASKTPAVFRCRRIAAPSWCTRSRSPSRSASISLRPWSARTGMPAAALPSLKVPSPSLISSRDPNSRSTKPSSSKSTAWPPRGT